MILGAAYMLWLFVPLMILYYYRPKVLQDTLHILIMALIVIALSRPMLYQGSQEIKIDAKDIIIAVDISYSMRAEDIKPNRYRYAKATIDALLSSNPTDNITLIAFTTNPLLLSPATTDHALISTALKTLKIENILTKGTSLIRLLQRVATLPMEEKNLILMTDGGEEGDIAPLRDIIEESSISLTLLALGTTQGTTLPHDDGSMLQDKAGDLVVSRINPMLKSLVSAVSGTYIKASTSPKQSATQIQEALDSSSQASKKVHKMRQSYTQLYQWFLFVAFVLFFMLHTRAVKFIILFVALFGTEASASLWDSLHLQRAYSHYKSQEYNATKKQIQKIEIPSLQSQIALASSYYKMQEYHKALHLYRGIRSRSGHIKQILYYDIANCYAQLEQYEKAREYYTKSLQLGSDRDALHNLGIVAHLKSRDRSKMSMAKPQAQEGSQAQADKEQEDASKEHADQQSAGGGGSDQKSTPKQKENMKKRITLEQSDQPQQPLSSKVYEMINKGYIYEKQPW